MSGLIDADVLIERIYEYQSKVIDTDDVIHSIKTMPTAYDVGNVVAELANNSRFVDDINEHNIKCISCVIGQKTAIDIVKRGGVE